MEESKAKKKQTIQVYSKIMSKITYYLRSKHINSMFNMKRGLLAAGGKSKRIDIFSNSLEHMASLHGHKDIIYCLEALSDIMLASGSEDRTIKIWDLKNKTIIFTLSQHSRGISAMCYVNMGVLISGSGDSSVIVWEYDTNRESSTQPRPRHVLTRHTSIIEGIIKINTREVISGERLGDLIIWNIHDGTCIRHITRITHFDSLFQMKKLEEANLTTMLVGAMNNIKIWGVSNNWELPIQEINEFKDHGWSLEIASRDILLRGGYKGKLDIIDYSTQIRYQPINLHSGTIWKICRIAKNIVVTAAGNGTLKVIDPIDRICYFAYKQKGKTDIFALTKFD